MLSIQKLCKMLGVEKHMICRMFWMESLKRYKWSNKNSFVSLTISLYLQLKTKVHRPARSWSSKLSTKARNGRPKATPRTLNSLVTSLPSSHASKINPISILHGSQTEDQLSLGLRKLNVKSSWLTLSLAWSSFRKKVQTRIQSTLFYRDGTYQAFMLWNHSLIPSIMCLGRR